MSTKIAVPCSFVCRGNIDIYMYIIAHVMYNIIVTVDLMTSATIELLVLFD